MIRPLPWDSAFFGFPVGIVESAPTPAELSQFRCVYWLTKPEDESPRELGFHGVDERITLEWKPLPIVAGNEVRLLRVDDLPKLRDTVRTAHTDSRFFQDARFDRERCADLYERWLERDVNEAEAWTLGDSPAGYITLTVKDGFANTGLLGVVEAQRGRGVAKSLISQAVRRSLELGLPCRVVTQGRNAAARKAYESAGFAEIERKAWWHHWTN